MEEYASLGRLLASAGARYVRNFNDIQVSGIAVDSRAIRPGWLFLAVRGDKSDGHRYIMDAARRGASALVVETEDFPRDSSFPRLPTAVVDDGRAACAGAAAEWYGRPSDGLRMVGVTGTNGKTTITYLIRSILEAAGSRVGLLGTIGYHTGSKFIPSSNTTPGPVELHSMLRLMADEGVTHAVMEVSSHSLVQKRVLGIGFDAGVFSNLRSDHMDFHGDACDYLKAKGALFSSVKPSGACVLNADDWASMVFAAESGAKTLFYSRRMRADLAVKVENAGLWGTEAVFTFGGSSFPVRIALPGMHNVENAAAAALAALSMGVDEIDVASGIEALKLVPGRLEPVETGLPFSVFVDYAHTEDALRAVLSNLKGRFDGRILTVFGCGGDRDRTKRPKMAAMVEKFSDFAVVTSDNPRTEDPMEIIREVVSGFASKSSYVINADRKAAIAFAVSTAGEGDVILIAGKGHEDYQEVNGKRLPFDDRKAAAEACVGRRASCGDGRAILNWLGTRGRAVADRAAG